MNTPRCFSVVFAGFAAFSFYPAVRAQVVFDNTGGATSFTANTAWILSSIQEEAVQFTAGSSAFLDYAELEVWNLGGSINVGLFANGAGTPGSLLETANALLPPNTGNPQSLLHVEFANTTFLTAGSVYWLAVSRDVGTTTAWEQVTQTGNVAFDTELGFGDPWSIVRPNSNQSGMRLVGGTPVPEPSTYGLVGSLLLVGIVAMRRRAKRA
jgi:hypothetical protein